MIQQIYILPLLHLTFLSIWAVVIIIETILELAPFKNGTLLEHTINRHYKIDIYIELPLIILVILSGMALLLSIPHVTTLHVVKLAFAGVAVGAGLACINLVIKRKRILDNNEPAEKLMIVSRKILKCGIGIIAGLITAAIGFYLAYLRLT